MSTSIVALGAVGALAQEAAPVPVTAAEPPASVLRLDPVTVTATRGERPVDEVPGTVSVITDSEIDRRLVSDPRDLLRYEPGVSIGSDPTRSGLTNYTIRGIGGNRVLVQVDGARLPDFPATSPTFNRDYVDLDTVKRVEIVRGPASSLYGSDAIGGVVAYITKDPADYLTEFGRDVFVSAKAGYDGADNSLATTATVAGRAGSLEGMLVATRRDGREVETNGRAEANPQDYFSNNLLGKLVWNAGDHDTLKLTGELRKAVTWTDIRSERSATVLDSLGRDTTDRYRLSLDHAHDAPIGFIDEVDWQLSWQRVGRSEDSTQRRLTAGQPRLRITDQEFEQDIWGLDVQLLSRAEIAGTANTFTYGIDIDYSDTSRPRERTETNLVTGAVTRFIGGELFPNKTFPDSTTLLAGAYVQDEIGIGRLSVIPGVRVDHYRLDPDPDQAYRNLNPGALQVGTVTETAVSPKLGATYRLDDRFTLFGQYARGFRSPPYDDANIGFTNAAFGYVVLPNPDLEPETSDGFEAGLRGNLGTAAFSVSGFYNRYRDFIEQVVVGTSGGLQLFQARNLERVKIWGAEAHGDWAVGAGFTLLGSLGYARGEDEDTGRPIDSVDPLKLVGGIRYDHPADSWGAELATTYTARKSRVSDAGFFQPPSSTVVDLMAYWDVTPNVTVNAGLFNLTDERYWNPQDVTGQSRTSTSIERYAQPGRTVAVNAIVKW
ncbi:TonB-dependent hemoglobin/transferrin/lactoferrin family receptor [Skermanella sp. TT6]|uniref:TonB-dependent hemoglobin/transferrin/lactoferrin family receptor n=1 Tax=Skermanella cutis TaxID=2775420 RepID=A0ABX7B1W6_9PROT|nr:TonB-dependent hemoglobin/transferrin/lactoferrin family receptor [Skermanella sp. TT6]QQP87844.1 TonB-dependent hemoglobin/transferrin/lactoferrin family receptor [Skermanella sp. TT6]